MKKRKPSVSRRGFIKTVVGSAAAASAIELVPGRAAEPAAPKYSDYLAAVDESDGSSAPAQPGDVEPPTEHNIEGPFYRPRAPFRTTLYEETDSGDRLKISGKVVARNGRPLPGAVLEIWHVDPLGHYDNDNPRKPPDPKVYRFRARLKTDDEGRYEFETIRPASYTIGPAQFRAAHIHVKVHCDGYRSLTTQFFFKGDPYNKTDPWFKRSMVLNLQPDGEWSVATFKFVLSRDTA